MNAGGVRNWLVVMVKVPHAGRVKTRLARAIGTVPATAFYRHSTNAVVQRLSGVSRWRTVLAIAPDQGVATPVFTHHIQRLPQGTGDLGQRMHRVMSTLGPGPVVIIGSDCPDITAANISQAFKALGSHDAVIGPAQDGGYWLIGLRRTPSRIAIFDNVRWSTKHAREDTLANLSGYRVAELQTLMDVDTGADFNALQCQPGRRILPVSCAA